MIFTNFSTICTYRSYSIYILITIHSNSSNSANLITYIDIGDLISIIIIIIIFTLIVLIIVMSTTSLHHILSLPLIVNSGNQRKILIHSGCHRFILIYCLFGFVYHRFIIYLFSFFQCSLSSILLIIYVISTINFLLKFNVKLSFLIYSYNLLAFARKQKSQEFLENKRHISQIIIKTIDIISLFISSRKGPPSSFIIHTYIRRYKANIIVKYKILILEHWCCGTPSRLGAAKIYIQYIQIRFLGIYRLGISTTQLIWPLGCVCRGQQVVQFLFWVGSSSSLLHWEYIIYDLH